MGIACLLFCPFDMQTQEKKGSRIAFFCVYLMHGSNLSSWSYTHTHVQVHAAAMSPAMRVHSLVAVATDDRRVRLCDLKSGGA
jgi:hypothetical protein